jgi:hypothetical protein
VEGSGTAPEKSALKAAFSSKRRALIHRGQLLARIAQVFHQGKFVEFAKVPGFSEDPRNSMGRASLPARPSPGH